MKQILSRFVGVELYFEHLEKAAKFLVETPGLKISEKKSGHHANSIVKARVFSQNGSDRNLILPGTRPFYFLKSTTCDQPRRRCGKRNSSVPTRTGP